MSKPLDRTFIRDDLPHVSLNPHDVLEIKSIRVSKRTGIIRVCHLHKAWNPNEKPFEMKTAFSKTGDYVGTYPCANLMEKYGICPEVIPDEDHSVCSIGFSHEEQKWFGWSHRALWGFEIGSTVERGDCAFIENDITVLQESFASAHRTEIKFDKDSHPIGLEVFEMTCDYEWPEDAIPGDTGTKISGSDKEYSFYKALGKGVWTAKTMHDAKQMAIDFANGVA
jgi:hypothetical protein